MFVITTISSLFECRRVKKSILLKRLYTRFYLLLFLLSLNEGSSRNVYIHIFNHYIFFSEFRRVKKGILLKRCSLCYSIKSRPVTACVSCTLFAAATVNSVDMQLLYSLLWSKGKTV